MPDWEYVEIPVTLRYQVLSHKGDVVGSYVTREQAEYFCRPGWKVVEIDEPEPGIRVEVRNWPKQRRLL